MLKTRYDFGTNKKKTNGYTAFKKNVIPINLI